jgi:hypothetical protein
MDRPTQNSGRTRNCTGKSGENANQSVSCGYSFIVLANLNCPAQIIQQHYHPLRRIPEQQTTLTIDNTEKQQKYK